MSWNSKYTSLIFDSCAVFLLHGLKEPVMDTCNVNKTVRALAVALKIF